MDGKIVNHILFRDWTETCFIIFELNYNKLILPTEKANFKTNE